LLMLTERDIEQQLTMREAIDAVELAFRQHAQGRTLMPARTTMMLEKSRGSISLMPSYLEEEQIVATKIISIFPTNLSRGLPTSQAHILVNDPRTGNLVALLEASHLTAMRTGAVTGVAAKYLARENAKTAAVLGCGVQGRTQALALTEVRRLDQVRCFDLDEAKRSQFAIEMAENLMIDVIPMVSGREAVRGADIVVTATTSKAPVLRRDWLSKGTHVSAVGSFYPDHRELDSETVRDAKVVVDSREAALLEAGDIIIPMQEESIRETHIYAELGELVSGQKLGRTAEDDLTVFKSVGLAIQDSAVTALILQKYSVRPTRF